MGSGGFGTAERRFRVYPRHQDDGGEEWRRCQQEHRLDTHRTLPTLPAARSALDDRRNSTDQSLTHCSCPMAAVANSFGVERLQSTELMAAECAIVVAVTLFIRVSQMLTALWWVDARTTESCGLHRTPEAPTFEVSTPVGFPVRASTTLIALSSEQHTSRFGSNNDQLSPVMGRWYSLLNEFAILRAAVGGQGVS